MMCGIFVVLLNARFDSRLALTIPIFAFIGIGVGLVIGLVVRLATRRVRLARG
jgi:NhaP-type Na+/H+ or K+/H+ antiporter